MNELSLFTGIGGGLLGTKLLGWRCIGAVDNDEYCCKVLDQRIKDGCFEPFDIFCMDIREFNRRVAPLYRGKTDVITAGPPCQPYSLAGNARGDQDELDMWPATIECIRLVRPRHLLLENVPNLLFHPCVLTIFGELAALGYYLSWNCVSAAFCGANHKRDRLWFVVDTNHDDRAVCLRSKVSRSRKLETGWDGSGVATDLYPPFPPTIRDKHGWDKVMRLAPEYLLPGMADGVTHKMDRFRTIGAAQVPAVVAAVWRLLNE